MDLFILTAGVFCLGVGVAVLWSNPRRFTNQVFAFISILVAGWLWTVLGIRLLGAQSGGAGKAQWLSANHMIGVVLAWATWLLHESIVRAHDQWWRTLRRSFPVLLVALPVLLLFASEQYFAVDSTGRGPGYYIAMSFGLIWHTWSLIRTAREMRRQVGLRRVEIQFLSVNLAITFLLVLVVSGVANWLRISELKNVSFFLFLAGFILAAWAMTFHRIFDARQIIVFLGQRVALLLAGATGLAASEQLLSIVAPEPWSFLLSLAICGSIVLWLDGKSRLWLRLGSERELGTMRQAIITTARTELDSKRLVAEFEHLLCAHFGAASARMIFNWIESPRAESSVSVPDPAALMMLCELAWATPESLERRRPSAGLSSLRQFIAARTLGILVPAPQGSASPTLLIAIGQKRSGWPFTSTEVQRLQNIAELMDNILTHSRLTSQAALQAKIEHLAMMSRGLAHDLKNLITPVSSFLIHTDGRYAADSAEAEVHAAARHSVRVMTDYVREALFFSERLQPKLDQLDIRKLFDGVRALAVERASTRGVFLLFRIDFSEPVIADGVLLQRLLVNLVNNAIDASARGETVRITARNGTGDWLKLEVADNGCGIRPEDLSRVFEPYFTTKQFGDDVRGFGLGLTICQKITNLHSGLIAVESKLGAGTRVTVDLPVSALSHRLMPGPPCLALP